MPDMPSEASTVRITALADRCVQCGLCLPACPTYALDATESESPRGRIALAAALARGETTSPAAALRDTLDHCLECGHCERACPAQVRYGELIGLTRAMLGPRANRPRTLIRLAMRPRLARALRTLAQWGGLARWRHALARRLPATSAWRVALDAVWTLPSHRRKAPGDHRQAAARLALDRVAIFPGCVASVDDAAALDAATILLRAAGHEVIAMPAFCCGGLDRHDGAAAAALHAANRVRAAWTRTGATRLVTVTPGCLDALRAALPEIPVEDPWPLLAAAADRLAFRPLQRRVALHLPCTQQSMARSETAMRALLQRVPGLACLPVADAPSCCGAAGSHMLQFPARAGALREPLLERITSLAADELLSSNIGCRLHLVAGLRAHGLMLAHRHPLELLAAQWLPTTNSTPEQRPPCTPPPNPAI